MEGWEERLLTCIHGVKEGIDYHDCPECKKIAEAKGLEWIDKKQTYVFLKDPNKI